MWMSVHLEKGQQPKILTTTAGYRGFLPKDLRKNSACMSHL